MRAGISSKVRVTRDKGHESVASEGELAPAAAASHPHGLSVVHCDDVQCDDEESAGPSNDSVPVTGGGRNAQKKPDPRALSELITQRIRSRTSDRIRDLEVISEDGRIVIRGRCATFYTKQLAQHAAMGVIEDEVVVNEISVGALR